jgi:hypothetical protein
MPHSEAQAWWADVQHVRESIERRRARGLDASAPLDAATEARFSRRAAESLPPLDDLEWSSGDWGQSTGRFDRGPRPQRRDHPRTDAPRARPRRSGSERRGEAVAERVDIAPETTGSNGGRATAEDTTAPRIDEPSPPAPSRRTVTITITGRGVTAPPLPRLVEVERRRPARRPVERIGPRPDRIALWAVLLGFFLILVAATSSNAAVHHAPASHCAAVALHAPAR